MSRVVYVEPRLRTPTNDIELEISADTQNYNVFQISGSPATFKDVKLSITAGTTVGSDDPLIPSIRFGPFPEGSTFTLVNSGTILGKGGAGGGGGQNSWSGLSTIGGGGGGGAGFAIGLGGSPADISFVAQSGTSGTATTSGAGAPDFDLLTIVSSVLPSNGSDASVAVEFTTSGTLENYGTIAGGGGGGAGSPGTFSDEEKGGDGGARGGDGEDTNAGGSPSASGGLGAPAITTSGAIFNITVTGTLEGKTSLAPTAFTGLPIAEEFPTV